MRDFNDLIWSKTYHLTKLQNRLYGEVDEYLTENKLSKTDFATQLGVSKGYVSQILNGSFDHKLSKMFELALAVDKIPAIEFLDATEYKRRELSKRIENMPLDLTVLKEAHTEKEACLFNAGQNKNHAEESLMEMHFE